MPDDPIGPVVIDTKRSGIKEGPIIYEDDIFKVAGITFSTEYTQYEGEEVQFEETMRVNMEAGYTFQDQDEMTIFLYSEELDVIELITYYHANATQLFISANETSVPDSISADINPLDYPMNIFRMVEKSPFCQVCIQYDEDAEIKSVWQEEYYDYNTNEPTQPTYTIGPSYLLKSNTERLTNLELSG